MVSQEARKRILDFLLNSSDIDLEYHLGIVSAPHTDELTVLADFTEATFPGYVKLNARTVAASAINGALQAQTGQVEYIFTANSSIVAAELIYSIYATFVDHTATTRLFWHAYFPVPKIVSSPGDEIRVKVDWFLTDLVVP